MRSTSSYTVLVKWAPGTGFLQAQESNVKKVFMLFGYTHDLLFSEIGTANVNFRVTSGMCLLDSKCNTKRKVFW